MIILCLLSGNAQLAEIHRWQIAWPPPSDWECRCFVSTTFMHDVVFAAFMHNVVSYAAFIHDAVSWFVGLCLWQWLIYCCLGLAALLSSSFCPQPACLVHYWHRTFNLFISFILNKWLWRVNPLFFHYLVIVWIKYIVLFKQFCLAYLVNFSLIYFVVHLGLAIISIVTSFLSPSQWLQAGGGAGDVGGGVPPSCVRCSFGFWWYHSVCDCHVCLGELFF